MAVAYLLPAPSTSASFSFWSISSPYVLFNIMTMLEIQNLQNDMNTFKTFITQVW